MQFHLGNLLIMNTTYTCVALLPQWRGEYVKWLHYAKLRGVLATRVSDCDATAMRQRQRAAWTRDDATRPAADTFPLSSCSFVSAGTRSRLFKFHCDIRTFAVGKFKVRPAKRTPVALCRIPRDIAGFTGSKALWG